MKHEPDSSQHQQQRSEFIRTLVQRYGSQRSLEPRYRHGVPKVIVQFWHDFQRLPSDIEECVRSWSRWTKGGFKHRFFDQHAALNFIDSALGARHRAAFEYCYHPAMQADYFRLCYLLINGGGYVDADDVCMTSHIEWLFNDGRLKLQPLCYDIKADTMVKPASFLLLGAYDPDWIFYFNNNPLIAGPKHPIIERALERATMLLELAGKDGYPEIQSTTGPGNISSSLFELAKQQGDDVSDDIVVLLDWDATAISRWPLSHRGDARNWRLSNQKRFFTDLD